MNIIILLLIVAAIVIIGFWFIKTEKKPIKKNKNPVYVCPECGDYHCNCFLEKNNHEGIGNKENE